MADRASSQGIRALRHRVDAASLIAGLSFTAIALAYWFADLDTLRDHARVLWPLVLLALGAALLATGMQRKTGHPGSGDPPGPGQIDA
ncbi:hypothetical protein BH20ACT2_BH20ACT2_15320 [soil metagenome]